MDDLNFRKRLIIDPQDNSDDINAAVEQDPSKKQFKQQMLDLDEQISSALDVPVPDNLADRLILSQSMDFQLKQKRKQRWHLALAASIAFTVGISFHYLGLNQHHGSVGDYALAHLYAEGEHLHDRIEYSNDELNLKLATFGAKLMDNVAPVNFANYCYFGGFKSLHLVFQGEHSPVSVFVIPNNTGLSPSEQFNDETYSGSSLQFKPAQMIIITDDAESNQKWQQKLEKSIAWQKA